MPRPYNDPNQILQASKYPEGLARYEMCVVGQRVPRLDATKLASGKPTYTDDFTPSGVLHAKILHSPLNAYGVRNQG